MTVQDNISPKVPQLRSLYFYLSSYCNCACRHCWISPEYLDQPEAPEEATLAMLTDIIDQAIPLGLKTIKLTGGEPLLCKHVKPLMLYAHEKKINISMESNGLLIDETMASFLSKVKVSHIAISLDGPDAATHEALRGVNGAFDLASKAIRFCSEKGLKTQAIMSLYHNNASLVEQTALYAQSLGARSLKLNCINSIERARELANDMMILNIREYLELKVKIEKDIQPKCKINIGLDLPPVFSFFPAAERSDNRCGIYNILGVLADAKLSICGIGALVPDLILPSLKEYSLKEIWSNSEILNSIRKDVPHGLKGICGQCMLKMYCLGKCRAEAYYRAGDLLAPLHICDEADKLGLFPEKFKIPIS